MKSAVEFNVIRRRFAESNENVRSEKKKLCSTSVWLEGADVSDSLFFKLKSNLSVKRSILFQFSKLVKKKDYRKPFSQEEPNEDTSIVSLMSFFNYYWAPEHTFSAFF